MKKKLIILCIMAILIIFLDCFYIEPQKLNIRFEKLESSKIDESFNDLKIIYFSDLHFKEDKKYILDNTINTINDLDPDIVIFGGDLIDTDHDLTNDDIEYLTNSLKSLNPLLGKYAVYGNHDYETDKTFDLIENIMYNANFETFCNDNIKVYNKSDHSFNLVFIDNMVNGNPNLDLSYLEIDQNQYTITICHTPDIFIDIPKDLTDYVLAGHAHGSQINIPLINHLYLPDGAVKYYKGKHKLDNVTLDITNGIGTLNSDARFMSSPEIVLYTLHHVSDNIQKEPIKDIDQKINATIEPTLTPTPIVEDNIDQIPLVQDAE